MVIVKPAIGKLKEMVMLGASHKQSQLLNGSWFEDGPRLKLSNLRKELSNLGAQNLRSDKVA